MQGKIWHSAIPYQSGRPESLRHTLHRRGCAAPSSRLDTHIQQPSTSSTTSTNQPSRLAPSGGARILCRTAPRCTVSRLHVFMHGRLHGCTVPRPYRCAVFVSDASFAACRWGVPVSFASPSPSPSPSPRSWGPTAAHLQGCPSVDAVRRSNSQYPARCHCIALAERTSGVS